MTKFSIIIPAYNCEKYICRTIESVLNQQYENYEILIIDDGSTDNTYNLCKKYTQDNSKIKCFSKKNEGVSSARNDGIKYATGDYILFLDADDYFLDNALNVLNKTIEKNRCELVKFRYIIEQKRYYNRIEIKTKLNQIIYKKDYAKEIYPNIFSSDFSNVWSCAFKKENIKELSFAKDIKFGEDNLFMIKSLLKSKSIYYVDEELYIYYLNSESATNKMTYNKTIKRIDDTIMVDKSIYEYILKQEGMCDEFIFDEYKKRINKDMYYLLAENVNRYSYYEYKKIIEYIKEKCSTENIPVDIKFKYNYIKLFINKNINKNVKSVIKKFAICFKIKWNNNILFKK